MGSPADKDYYNVKTSAAKKSPASPSILSRLAKNVSNLLTSVNILDLVAPGAEVSAKKDLDTKKKKEQQAKKEAADKKKQSGKDPGAKGTVSVPSETVYKTPSGFKFNLPPHSWSMPTRPIEVLAAAADAGGEYTDEKGKVIGKWSGDPDATKYMGKNEVSSFASYHGYRRGRIWFWDTSQAASTISSDGTVSTAKGAEVSAENKAKKAQIEKTGKVIPQPAADAYNYGFQFLWNPTSIGVSVSRNMSITPSAADVYTSVAGAFPGQESVSFTIVIDRVNDFACAKGIINQAGGGNNITAIRSLEPYYKGKYPLASTSETFEYQMKNLLNYGTMADLEYLFKAINGAGDGSGWKNLLGKTTADIGYLQPSLLAFELGGESAGDLGIGSSSGLSYVGWISSFSIQHTVFTEDMVPLHSEVSISVDCFAGSTLV
jgi:hypothetical protein